MQRGSHKQNGGNNYALNQEETTEISGINNEKGGLRKPNTHRVY